MSYLHCHNCHFSQDDFWDMDSWNPVMALKRWLPDLITTEKIDEPFTDDAGFIRENGNITLREVVAREFERKARHIRQMKYRTKKELENKNPGWICPICKQKELDID